MQCSQCSITKLQNKSITISQHKEQVGHTLQLRFCNYWWCAVVRYLYSKCFYFYTNRNICIVAAVHQIRIRNEYLVHLCFCVFFIIYCLSVYFVYVSVVSWCSRWPPECWACPPRQPQEDVGITPQPCPHSAADSERSSWAPDGRLSWTGSRYWPPLLCCAMHWYLLNYYIIYHCYSVKAEWRLEWKI